MPPAQESTLPRPLGRPAEANEDTRPGAGADLVRLRPRSSRPTGCAPPTHRTIGVATLAVHFIP